MPQPLQSERRAFLLLEGGPLYRIQKRLGLVRAHSSLIVRRAVLSIGVTWVPLLILSTVGGYDLHNVDVPFLKDIASGARFLLAIPLLLLAEVVTGPRLAHAAAHFIDAGLILEKDYAEYDAAVASGLRLRDAVVPEAILILLSYVISFIAFGSIVHSPTWFRLVLPTGSRLTLAGWWYLFFCVPLFNFLILRWLWRLFLWYRFLHQMNSLDLQLFSTHPDQAGGLGFLGETQRFFSVVFFAYSCATSGVVANAILFDHAKLSSFYASIGAYIAIVAMLALAPLFMFTGRLLNLRRIGIFRYGALATAYTGDFEHKWVTPALVRLGVDPPSASQIAAGSLEAKEPLLGTADIQSLADLGNSYAYITRMNFAPFTPRAILQIIVVCIVPMAPLVLTIMSLSDLLQLLLKLVA